MKDWLNTDRLSRLREAMQHSRTVLRPFRKNRMDGILAYVGGNYSESGAKRAIPVNLIELAVRIYHRQLAARPPKALVTTKVPALRPVAADLALGLDHLMGEIKLYQTIQKAVLDALFLMGIAKVGLNYSRTVELGGVLHDVGQPFVDWVSPDDWVHDTNAVRWEDVSFCGNRFRLPLDLVKDAKLYDPKATAKLEPSYRNPGGEADGDRDSDAGGDRRQAQGTEFEDLVELWELWLPHQGLVVTLSADDENTPPLRVSKWTGPEHGPFHLLSFGDVPGNLVPLSPVNVWRDLHEVVNRAWRKLSAQAEAVKTVGVVGPGGEKDAERIISAGDGQFIRSDSPGSVQALRVGGIDQTLFAFGINAKGIFSSLAGNLDSIGGLGPQAETATAEEIIRGSASAQLNDLRDRTILFTTDIVHDLAFYAFYDPLIELPIVKEVGALGLTISKTLTADDLEGDFLDYNFDINPYAQEFRSPGQRLGAVMQFVSGILLPALPMAMQQGITIDFRKLAQVAARLSDLPEIEEILMFEEPPEQPAPVGEPPAKAPVTTRNYVRTSRPGATTQGQDQSMSRLMMGSKLQDSEAASLTRGVG